MFKRNTKFLMLATTFAFLAVAAPAHARPASERTHLLARQGLNTLVDLGILAFAVSARGRGIPLVTKSLADLTVDAANIISIVKTGKSTGVASAFDAAATGTAWLTGMGEKSTHALRVGAHLLDLLVTLGGTAGVEMKIQHHGMRGPLGRLYGLPADGRGVSILDRGKSAEMMTRALGATSIIRTSIRATPHFLAAVGGGR